MNIDYQTLSKRISDLRRKKGLTQESLAEKTELSSNYISHIENSRSIPSLETLMKLCSALDITPDEVLLGTKQDMENYLQSDIQKKLILCTPKERRMVSRFIDLLLEEREEKNYDLLRKKEAQPFGCASSLFFLSNGYLVEYFFAFFEDDVTLCKSILGNSCVKSSYLFIVYRDTALFY